MTTPAHTMHRFEAIVGRWKTSGVVLDEHGRQTMNIDGTDEYEWMAGGGWILHRVDVMMGDAHTRALELIGDYDPDAGTYAMRAFDASGAYSTMTAHPNDDGSWLFDGEGMRSTLRPSEDKSSMSALWERETGTGIWVPWMRMNFSAID
ncbi:DUF1579 family protein [Nocardia sp. NBC_01329]|uniref:DUF1579 family protein n=1 Tax=Nocardia sp. NBC_01329 TaxID=2903594 RepID=UPI002E12EF34|nr:DUF1579 family protein [Nocardia sp. NBC_01329]